MGRLINPGDVGPLLAEARIGLFGDSIAGSQSQSTSTDRYTSACGMVPWACALSGGRLTTNPNWNYGVSGERTDEMLTRLSAAVAALVAAGVRFVFISGGTNDIFQKRTPADVFANIVKIATTFRDAGITPILLAIMPRTYASLATSGERTTARNQQSWINNSLRAWSVTTPGVVLLDLVRQVTDPADVDGNPLGGSATKTGLTYDQLHPATRLGYLGGKAIVAALSPILPPRKPYYATAVDVYHATENPLGNKLVNGKLTGTTGTDGTGATGDQPTSWTASRSGGSTATVVGSKVTATDPDGGASTEWYRMTITASGGTAGSADTIRLRQSVTLASGKYAIGDRVKLRTRVRVIDADGLFGVSPVLTQQDTGNIAFATGMVRFAVSAVTYLFPDVAIDEMILETPDTTINAAMTTIQCDLLVSVDAGSSAAILDFTDVELIPA